MGSLFGALRVSANNMRVLDRAISVVQNNVSNIETPGYAKQRLLPTANKFQPEGGLTGGISEGPIESSRQLSAEASVRKSASQHSAAEQRSAVWREIEQIVPVSNGMAGVDGALDGFFQSFSALSIHPNNRTAREAVLEKANGLAASLQTAGRGLQEIESTTDGALQSTVNHINELAARIQNLNQSQRNGGGVDPGVDAELHASLEELSTLVDIGVVIQDDGTATVTLGGETPLVLGQNQYPIELDLASGGAQVLDSFGNEVTQKAEGGKLAALLHARNTDIPGAQDRLNGIAKTIADQVNTRLAAGVNQNGVAPTEDLFVYDPAQPAASLQVNDLEPGDLAVAAAAGGNEVALQIFELRNSRVLDGDTLKGAYASLASFVGRQTGIAQQNSTTQEQLLLQSRAFREELSGVDLNEEATRLVELQRGYEAIAKMVNVLDDLTQTALSLLR